MPAHGGPRGSRGDGCRAARDAPPRGECAMNTAKGIWAAADTSIETGAATGEGAEVVEAVLSWRDARGDNALGRTELRLRATARRAHQTEAPAGGAIVLGEQGDLMVPAEVL